MKIAVDVASGENPSRVLIEGAIDAVRESDIELILVGDEGQIKADLKSFSYNANSISIVHTDEVIGMDESPATACRRKKNSSVMLVAKLVGEGRAEGLFSPGNTGATLAASLMNIKRIKGISRPGLATLLPNKGGKTLLLDVGANVDCSPLHLAHFAVMGASFVKEVLGIKKPRVGILSIGEEEKKGNELSLKAYDIISSLDIGFIGNVEGHDVFSGKADIVVCDGFVGNILIKGAEGLGSVLSYIMKQEMDNKLSYYLAGILSRDLFRKTTGYFHPSNYGGAPLLGVSGSVIIGHGKSDSLAAKNAVLMAGDMAKMGLNKSIAEDIDKYF